LKKLVECIDVRARLQKSGPEKKPDFGVFVGIIHHVVRSFRSFLEATLFNPLPSAIDTCDLLAG